MREIKFRGYNNFEHEWVYGYYVKYLDTDFIYFPEEDGVDSCEVLPETVGQYVGLKDINGVEIYEGDIVKVIYNDKDYEIMTVVWNKEKAKFEYIDKEKIGWTITYTPIKVIGNIYENKELLKEE